LDLQFGLPVQVRDTALEDDAKNSLPKDEVNRAYAIEASERNVNQDDTITSYGKVSGALAKPNALLTKLRRPGPYYARNLPHLCSFYAKGACNRGAACPYRHEMPITGELANQNIKDRYFGQNDPVANKLLGRSKSSTTQLKIPEDQTITTLWLGGVDEKTTEADIKDKFSPFGQISSVHIVPLKSCAFVTFLFRSSAEEAAAKFYNNLILDGHNIRLDWGKKPASNSSSSSSSSSTGYLPPGMTPRTLTSEQPLIINKDANKFLTPPSYTSVPPPPGMKTIAYPSMDPRAQAVKLPS
jgi:pre-mRNA-splicing factor RBM22/SLT11